MIRVGNIQLPLSKAKNPSEERQALQDLLLNRLKVSERELKGFRIFKVHSVSDMESVLATQLKRLQTDHIDYYLVHALNSKKG